MVIKAWPYGRKPGIAVAKETNSHLLTVWTLKLWGAVAPVASWRKKNRKIKAKQWDGNNHCPCFLSCEISTLSNLWIWAWWLFVSECDSLNQQRRGFDFAPTCTAKKILLSISCLHRPQSAEYSTQHYLWMQHYSGLFFIYHSCPS